MENTQIAIPQKQLILTSLFLVTDCQTLIRSFSYKIRLRTEVTGIRLIETSPYWST